MILPCWVPASATSSRLNIAILPLQNTLYRNIKTEKKGFFSEKRNHTYRSNTVTNRTNIGSGSDLLISSTNKNIVIQAANLTAGGDLSLDASRGQIALLTAKEREVEQIERYKANAVWWVAEQEGFIRENVIHNHIKAGGQIYFRANKRCSLRLTVMLLVVEILKHFRFSEPLQDVVCIQTYLGKGTR